MANKTININVPVLARVEGEGALDLEIKNDQITDLKLRIYEPPRFFEQFLLERSYQDVPDTVARICGICPVAYQMSAVHAIESIFNVQVTPWVRAMRRVMYCGEWLQSHSLHIHMLAAPDFLGFNSILEMSKDYSKEVNRGLSLQTLGNDLISLFGARSVHPVGVRTGGFYHAPSQKTVDAIRKRLEAAQFETEELVRWTASLDLPDDQQQFTSVSLRHPHEYPLNEGRIVSDAGHNPSLDIDISEYDNHFVEQHISHSTALHSLLDGKPYLVGPLARLNLNIDKLPASVQSIIESSGIRFPSNNMFHSIVARAIEANYVVSEALQLLNHYKKPDFPYVEYQPKNGIGFGCTEAPRGLLWHRYELDSQGKVSQARIVPPTSQNQARIEQDLRQSLITLGLNQKEQTLRLHAEKVIRNYDPCISCATHFLRLDIKHYQEKEETINPKDVQQNNAAPRIKIIGVGSQHGNDKLGFEALQLLKEDKQLSSYANVNYVSITSPGTQLIDALKETDYAIIIDAIAIHDEPGKLLKLNANEITTLNPTLSSHGLGVIESIKLGQALKQIPQNIVLMGLNTDGNSDWTYNETQLQELINEVRQLIIL